MRDEKDKAGKSRKRVRRAVLGKGDESFDIDLDLDGDAPEVNDDLEKAVDLYVDGCMDLFDSAELANADDFLKSAAGVQKCFRAAGAFVILSIKKWIGADFEFKEEIGALVAGGTAYYGARRMRKVAEAKKKHEPSGDDHRPTGERKDDGGEKTAEAPGGSGSGG